VKEDLSYKIKIENGKYFIREKSVTYDIPLDKRIFNFVVRIIKYLQKLPKSNINNVIIYQLTKASSSIGANYDEAQGASSKKDFIAKVSIAHREAKESHYWLRLLKGSEIDDSNELNFLIQESFELRNILGSIVGKVRKGKK
jgi:four helix bundle protein